MLVISLKIVPFREKLLTLLKKNVDRTLLMSPRDMLINVDSRFLSYKFEILCQHFAE